MKCLDAVWKSLAIGGHHARKLQVTYGIWQPRNFIETSGKGCTVLGGKREREHSCTRGLARSRYLRRSMHQLRNVQTRFGTIFNMRGVTTHAMKSEQLSAIGKSRFRRRFLSVPNAAGSIQTGGRELRIDALNSILNVYQAAGRQLKDQCSIKNFFFSVRFQIFCD
jgi:hypothetical protein